MNAKSTFDDTWGGTISVNEFRIAAQTFVEKWRIFNTNLPPWSWIPCPISPFSSSQADGYLCLENMCIFKPVKEDHDTGEEFRVLKEEEEEFDDAAMLVEGGNEELHFYDFHIVYSTTYRVPLLYFRKHHSDGQPLALEDIEKHLPTLSAEELLKSKWTFITQEEHPYLMRPWYKLHACGTSEWMKLLFLANFATSAGKNGAILELYLISWLSVVGQVVGLKIPLEMLNKFV